MSGSQDNQPQSPEEKLRAYQREGKLQGVDKDVLAHSFAISNKITDYNPNLTPLFSLRHLSFEAGVDYKYLRKIVARSKVENYHSFKLRKNGKQRGYRTIVVPCDDLMQVQRWILHQILDYAQPHKASFAYQKGKTIADAAALHCNSQWLIKLDVQRFFESFSEVAVYRVFQAMGYQPLLAFEMARICTRIGKKTSFNHKPHWRVHPADKKPKQPKIEKPKMRFSFIKQLWQETEPVYYEASERKYEAISCYQYYRMGHLPQGAPTSPMLANLIMRDFDKRVSKIAQDKGLVYTRYSDDITLSSTDKTFGRLQSQAVIAQIYRVMSEYGLSPNKTKTKIVPVGQRKQVLGLLVDSDKPALNKAFRDNLRLHLYYLTKAEVGPIAHAQKRGFVSVEGLKNHIRGLIAYAVHIDPIYAKRYQDRFERIDWPKF